MFFFEFNLVAKFFQMESLFVSPDKNTLKESKSIAIIPQFFILQQKQFFLDCSNPPLLFHGVFYPDPPHLPGADIHYSCDAQYAATNPGATIKCKSTGDWEINEFPSCIFGK